MLCDEVNILRSLNHPNIVRCSNYLIAHKTRRIYIIQEYCDGGDLSTYLSKKKERGQLVSESFIWSVLSEVASALKHCHSFGKSTAAAAESSEARLGIAGSDSSASACGDNQSTSSSVLASGPIRRNTTILHRDLKPSNIFLTRRGRSYSVKLGDFGLAKVLNQSLFAQTHVGTPYYMSPEQILQQQYNHLSDMWSLGAVIYEMVTLGPPFRASNYLALAMQIQKGCFKPLSDICQANYSREIQRVIESLLKVDPHERATVDDILQLSRVQLQLKAIRIDRRYLMLKKREAEFKEKELELLKRERRVAKKEAELAKKEYEREKEAAEVAAAEADEAAAALSQATISMTSNKRATAGQPHHHYPRKYHSRRHRHSHSHSKSSKSKSRFLYAHGTLHAHGHGHAGSHSTTAKERVPTTPNSDESIAGAAVEVDAHHAHHHRQGSSGSMSSMTSSCGSTMSQLPSVREGAAIAKVSKVLTGDNDEKEESESPRLMSGLSTPFGSDNNLSGACSSTLTRQSSDGGRYSCSSTQSSSGQSFGGTGGVSNQRNNTSTVDSSECFGHDCRHCRCSTDGDSGSVPQSFSTDTTIHSVRVSDASSSPLLIDSTEIAS